MKENSKNIIRNLLSMFSIPHTLKRFNISKSDFKKIQENLSHNLAFLSLLTSIACTIIGIMSLIFMFSNVWNPSTNSVFTYIAISLIIFGSITSFIILFIGLFTKKTYSHRLVTIGDLILHIVVIASCLLFFMADLYSGALSATEAITPSITLGFLLLLCQPGSYVVAFIFNVVYFLSLIGMSIFGLLAYDMKALDQYILISVLIFIFSYIIYSLYNYIEVQRFYVENYNSELLFSSTHDSLTKVRNRAGLKLYVEDHEQKWKMNNHNVLLIMLDIDDFKMYNDTFGHLNGDDVLYRIAQTIDSLKVEQHAHLFRYGGEEFLITVRDVNEDEALRLMEFIRKSVEDLHIKAPQGSLHEYVTISLGGSLVTADEDYNFHDHVEIADEALYDAKKGTKNKSVLRITKK